MRPIPRAHLMNDVNRVDQALAVIGLITEAVCLLCCLVERTFRFLPMLTYYLAYTTAAEAVGYIIFSYGSAHSYWMAYACISILGYMLEIMVILELAYRIAKPVESEFSMSLIILTACGFAVVAILVTSLVSYREVETTVGLYLHFDLAFCVLRVLSLGTILALARILRIGWSNRAVQVTACLSLYSAFGLLAQIAHEYASRMTYQYGGFATIERLRTSAWCVTMLLLSWHVLAYSRSTRNEQNVSGAWSD